MFKPGNERAVHSDNQEYHKHCCWNHGHTAGTDVQHCAKCHSCYTGVHRKKEHINSGWVYHCQCCTIASHLSLEATVAVIVVPIVAVTVIVAVVFVLLFICCCKCYSRKLKYNIATAAGTTGIQELHTMDVVSSANKTTTFSDTFE